MASREKTENIRNKIIEAADNLLYHKGYNLMSFSDIADASGIPRGNLNYHFKTKDEVLSAVIDYRVEKMGDMLQDWQANIPTALERLKRFAKIPVNEIENVRRYGCPMGSLNTELGKVQPDLKSLSRMQFDVFREWLIEQFKMLVSDQKAKEFAMHLLVRTQGLATMTHVYNDSSLLVREVEKIYSWLESQEYE